MAEKLIDGGHRPRKRPAAWCRCGGGNGSRWPDPSGRSRFRVFENPPDARARWAWGFGDDGPGKNRPTPPFFHRPSGPVAPKVIPARDCETFGSGATDRAPDQRARGDEIDVVRRTRSRRPRRGAWWGEHHPRSGERPARSSRPQRHPPGQCRLGDRRGEDRAGPSSPAGGSSLLPPRHCHRARALDHRPAVAQERT